MDDETSPGLSGFAGYCLGRMAVKSEQSTHRLIESLRFRRQPQSVVYEEGAVINAINGWKAAVRSRDVTIAQLQTQFAGLAARHDQLRVHNEQLQAELVQSHEAYAALKDWEANTEQLWQHASERGEKAQIALEDAEHKVRMLKAEIERLEGNAP